LQRAEHVTPFGAFDAHQVDGAVDLFDQMVVEPAKIGWQQLAVAHLDQPALDLFGAGRRGLTGRFAVLVDGDVLGIDLLADDALLRAIGQLIAVLMEVAGQKWERPRTVSNPSRVSTTIRLMLMAPALSQIQGAPLLRQALNEGRGTLALVG